MRVKNIFIAILLLALTGCSNFKPWVKPYQRSYLADELMAFEKDPVSTRYMNHVYEAREAGRGAEGSSGGGCGCN
ncbi:DUF4266 domain-containing protein [Marinagarivorans algicola]|uniref:DUF4266 domain-containing protein n=1 Tax=Marinagarivorans algicola TaxID=1513270 RepID=UPI0006B47E0C|nr:DUF4266 domain-containing protein [Marinagarivorans algicola]